MDIKLEISLAEIIQILILVTSLGVFYFKMVKAFTQISIMVATHQKLLYRENGETDVVTYSALDRIRNNCPNNYKIGRLEHDVEALQQGEG